jgi:hypothetical protein
MMKKGHTILEQIEWQRSLSNGVIAAIRPLIQQEFFPDRAEAGIECGDMSSFARGTNNDSAPDIDVIFLNVSRDESQGYKDWTPIGTRQLTGKKEGITSVAELEQYDNRTAAVIPRLQLALENYFEMPAGRAVFNFFRTWEGYPGYVSNIALPHSKFEEISVDLNIYYSAEHYGIEHNRRFLNYFNRLMSRLGPEVAAQLIQDIKLVKQKGKDNVRGADGWIDRTRKLFGFIVEGLFSQRFPPYSYAELMEAILAHQWEPDVELEEHWVGDQTHQIIDAGFNFSGLLHNLVRENRSFPKGSWENLWQIAEEYKISL